MPDDDGWTNVRRGKGSRAPTNSPKQPSHDRTITVANLHTSYKKAMTTWETSSCRTKLHDIIDNHAPDSGWQIDDAICIASGTFTRDDLNSQRRSMQQLCAFMDTVAHIESTVNHTLSIHAEEMGYSETDIAFLESLNVTVHNQTEDEYESNLRILAPISEHSLVFEFFIDSSSLPTLMQIMSSDVALLIGTDPVDKTALMMSRNSEVVKFQKEDYSPGESRTSPQRLKAAGSDELKGVRKKFGEVVEKRYFPTFEPQPEYFTGLSVFWRRPVDEADESETS